MTGDGRMLVLILCTYADHAEHVRPKLRTHAMLSPAKYPNVLVASDRTWVGDSSAVAHPRNKIDFSQSAARKRLLLLVNAPKQSDDSGACAWRDRERA